MVNRTTITIHTRQRTVVRSLSDASLVRCAACNAQVLALPRAAVAGTFQIPDLTLSELTASGWLHAIKTVDGTFICCNSILAAAAHLEPNS